MKVFMTGASGYIGGAVAEKLQSKGHEIFALARTRDSVQRLRTKGYNVIPGDMLKPVQWKHLAAQAEVFIHCAQRRLGKRIGASWVRKAAAADQTAFTGVIEAAKQSLNCKAVIYTSGISVVGDHGDRWVDESTIPKIGQTVGSYHLQGEQLAKTAYNNGLPVVIIRPSLPVAANGSFADFFLSPAENGKLRLIGEGKNFFPTVHLDDLANAFALAAETPPIGQTLIVSDDNPLTMEELFNTLLKQFGKGKAKRAPEWLVSLIAGKPLANLLVSSFRVRNDKAKEILGWKPRYPTFNDSLKQIMSKESYENYQVW